MLATPITTAQMEKKWEPINKKNNLVIFTPLENEVELKKRNMGENWS